MVRIRRGLGVSSSMSSWTEVASAKALEKGRNLRRTLAKTVVGIHRVVSEMKNGANEAHPFCRNNFELATSLRLLSAEKICVSVLQMSKYDEGPAVFKWPNSKAD